MGILRKSGSDGGRARGNEQDQNAMVRSDQSQLARDPFQLMQRDPFQLMREMMINPYRVFQQLAPYGGFTREGQELTWNPSFDVRETDDAFLLEADMPGIRTEDLDISLVGDSLQISGKRDREEERDEGTAHMYERSYGQFSRSFGLPDTVDVDKIRCDLKDGVLRVVVPKKPGTAPHRRKIQIGSGAKS